MSAFVLVIAIITFLSGGTAAVFLTLVAGIRTADRPRPMPGAQDTLLDAFTRSMLGTGSWPHRSAVSDPEDEDG